MFFVVILFVSCSKIVVDSAKVNAIRENANAQFNLGWMYDVVDFVNVNAIYKVNAILGNANAQFNLGWMYYDGRGVEKDYKKAIEWYTKSAEQGVAVAQYNLGVMYSNGQGVDTDYKKAIEWFKKSAEQGYGDAQLAFLLFSNAM